MAGGSNDTNGLSMSDMNNHLLKKFWEWLKRCLGFLIPSQQNMSEAKQGPKVTGQPAQTTSGAPANVIQSSPLAGSNPEPSMSPKRPLESGTGAASKAHFDRAAMSHGVPMGCNGDSTDASAET